MDGFYIRLDPLKNVTDTTLLLASTIGKSSTRCRLLVISRHFLASVTDLAVVSRIIYVRKEYAINILRKGSSTEIL